jgi:hypothetical protein
VVVGDDRVVALVGDRRLVHRDEVDVRVLAPDPREAVAQRRRRQELGEAEQLPEAHAVAHLAGAHFERDVLEHVRKPTRAACVAPRRERRLRWVGKWGAVGA